MLIQENNFLILFLRGSIVHLYGYTKFNNLATGNKVATGLEHIAWSVLHCARKCFDQLRIKFLTCPFLQPFRFFPNYNIHISRN